jgi:site-specific DNA recombinase
MNTPRFFIYARKSTDDTSRQVRSIADQLAEVKELAERERLEIADVFIERQTVKAPGRPVFNQMLDRIERGEANGILAWHPDRLARNSLDGGRIIYLVDTGKISDLKFPTFRFEPTAQGKFMLSVMFGQSKYYVDSLSENIQRGKRQKIKNGIWPQWAPMGYLNDHATRTIVPDPKKAPLVRKMFEWYATGERTLKGIRETLVGLGLTGQLGRPVATSKVQDALKNPIYYGMIRFKGELYEGKHEPLITKALFDKCQEVMTVKCHPKKSVVENFRIAG